MLTTHNPSSPASIESLTTIANPSAEITHPIQSATNSDASGSQAEPQSEFNLALAPEEIATLTSLVSRYDQLLLEVDALNQRIEDLLKSESPPAKQ